MKSFFKCDDTKTKLSVDYIEICEILNVNMEKNRSIYIIWYPDFSKTKSYNRMKCFHFNGNAQCWSGSFIT